MNNERERLKREKRIREPGPDEQGRPTQEAGGSVALPTKREQVSRPEVLRETR